ncbi:MAG: hypothetical protein I3273_00525 [Candidatus Moeniiplasma glomeromycotorum]|nr:hypothetical protein [Candidatus Moeniiplasma glomeromycotorum]MCE8167390.1 hypothetical protein [Candidatus Moeniiplasma glomeromycotorum]MCE8168597.1 hypothetical protein [Candidatus Moeniiplasma glomeromycotorum]
MTRTLSIAIKENTFRKLRKLVKVGKISAFFNRAAEKELGELEKEQKKEKEELRQKLIEGYQSRTKNEKLKNMLRNYGEMSWGDISTKLTAREKNNVKAKK